MSIDINGSGPYLLMFCIFSLMALSRETLWLSRSVLGDIAFQKAGHAPEYHFLFLKPALINLFHPFLILFINKGYLLEPGISYR